MFLNYLKASAGKLDGKQRKQFLTSVVFMFFSSFLEFFTLGLIIPFLGIVVAPASVSHGEWVANIIALLGQLSPLRIILILGTGVLFMFLLKNGLASFLYSYYNRFVYSIATDLSRRTLVRYYASSFPEYQKVNSPEMLRLTAQVPIEFAHHIVLGSMVIISEAMVLSLFAAGVAVYQFRLFLIISCSLLPFAILAWQITHRYLRTAKQTIRDLSPASLNKLSDVVNGYQEATIGGSENYFINRYVGVQGELNNQLGRLNAANALPPRLSEIFAVAGIILILAFSFGLYGEAAAPVVPLLVLFVTFAYRAVPSVNKILAAAVQMRTYSFTIDLLPDAVAEAGAVESKSMVPGEPPVHFSDTIELRKISYSYPGRTVRVLDGLSLRITKGEMVGIAGRSGLGKSTMARILMQLLQQDSGSILVDGRPLPSKQNDAWKKCFSYVSQDPVVLADSIEANVAFGVPQSLVSSTRVHQALRKAGLGTFINQLPDGIKTQLGEKAKTISGGQRQRLAIARALYRDADIFIFDEAMSELDAVSERGILDTLAMLRLEGKTILLVSHRGRILSACTSVYTLRRGRLEPGLGK